MRFRRFPPIVLALLLAQFAPSLRAEPILHSWLQSVNPDGSSASATNLPPSFSLRGILLNDPAEMMSIEFNPAASNQASGARYQVFLQADAPGDFGGTALFMGQYPPSLRISAPYDAAAWSAEMARLAADPASGRPFAPGDLVEVRASRALHYGGKVNVNEAHSTDPACDFSLVLLAPAVGLPPPVPLRLSNLVDAASAPLFDPSRASGPEHFQGARVRLDAIRLRDPAPPAWDPSLPFAERLVVAVDSAGRSFPLRLPRTPLGPPPATSVWFSAVGILNQESSSSPVSGYELFVQQIGPSLSIARSDGAVVVSASPGFDGFALESSDDSAASWSPVPGAALPFAVPASAPPSRLYRLALPDP